MTDLPIDECIKTAQKLMNHGHDIYQKFTCENCGSRQTIDEKNLFFTSGKCEECSHVTDITKKGCGYLAVVNFK